MKPVGACGNRFVVSKELVGAFCASTAPAASTAPHGGATLCECINRLGCLDGSALGALSNQRHERTCASAR